MAFILCIETATKNCSVALAKDGITIALSEFAGEGYGHAEKLHVFINEVLKAGGITFNDLHAVAVSMGPGSYTGLRIGVSTAKGLCYALDIPLITADRLTLLAYQTSVQHQDVAALFIPLITAREKEYFIAIYPLLLDRLTIEAIANQSGFKSIATFYNAFKKETGLMPTSYFTAEAYT